MKFNVVVTYEMPKKSVGMGRAEWGVALKNSLKDGLSTTGATWHEKMLPVHFTQRGGYIYGYEERQRRYQKKKKRLKGHNDPIKWSGETERQLKSHATIRSTTQRVTVKMDAPWYFARSSNIKKHKMPDMVREVQTIAGREVKEFSEIIDKQLQYDLNNSIKVRT